MRQVGDLFEQDFRAHPVWRLVESSEGDTLASPVHDLPLATLDNCVVGTDVLLADGSSHFAVLANVSALSALSTEQFLTATFFLNGGRWVLARYFDDDWDHQGPLAFAKRLGRQVDQIFPVTYDLSMHCSSRAWSLKGMIEAVPRASLSEAERLDLIMSELD